MKNLILLTIFIACASSLFGMSDELLDAIEYYNQFHFEQSADCLEPVWEGPIESPNDFNEAFVYMKTLFALGRYSSADSIVNYMLTEVSQVHYYDSSPSEVEYLSNCGLTLFWGLSKLYADELFCDNTGIIFNSFSSLDPTYQVLFTPYFIEVNKFDNIREALSEVLARKKIPRKNTVLLYGLVTNITEWNQHEAEMFYHLSEKEQYISFRLLRLRLWHAVYFLRIHDEESLHATIEEIVQQLHILDWNQPLELIFTLIPGQRVYEPVREDFEYIKGLIYERMGEAPPEE